MINRTLEGERRSVRLRADEVEVAQGLINEYKQFQAISVAFIRASEELARDSASGVPR